MGVWGTALYSGDFALDLRTTVAAVARLPFDGDRLLELLCETEPTAAREAEDEDHTVFWLVVADQFARRGIACAQARDTALAIIDEGRDLAMMRRLGMDEAGLRKRGKKLAELRAGLAAAPVAKPRSVLKKPQPYVFESGDVFVFPTSGGSSINPYFPSKDQIPGDWRQDGWGAMIIAERGRAFDFLTWYRPLTAPAATRDKPSLQALEGLKEWVLERPGTITPLHKKRMELERVGAVPIDPDKLARLFPARPSGVSDAVSNISLANRLLSLPVEGVVKPVFQLHRKIPKVGSLREIMRD